MHPPFLSGNLGNTMTTAGTRPDYVGLRHWTKARSTGTQIGVYNAVEAGMDNDPSVPWYTVCEDHGDAVGHPTLALARSFASAPEEWCSQCQKQVHGPLAKPGGGFYGDEDDD